HRHELSEQLNTIEDQFNELKIRIAGQNVKQQKHELMKQIDEWEYESIEKIRQVANEVRRELSLSVTKVVTDLDFKLNRLTEQIVKFRKDEDIAETDIQVFNEELQRLKTNLKNPLNFKIKRDSTSFINKIHLGIKGKSYVLVELTRIKRVYLEAS
ncbi:unnamed protein product, partial [Rotaria sp. Silwood2]